MINDLRNMMPDNGGAGLRNTVKACEAIIIRANERQARIQKAQAEMIKAIRDTREQLGQDRYGRGCTINMVPKWGVDAGACLTYKYGKCTATVLEAIGAGAKPYTEHVRQWLADNGREPMADNTIRKICVAYRAANGIKSERPSKAQAMRRWYEEQHGEVTVDQLMQQFGVSRSHAHVTLWGIRNGKIKAVN